MEERGRSGERGGGVKWCNDRVGCAVGVEIRGRVEGWWAGG